MEAEQVTCLILSHGLTYVSPPISGRQTKVAKDQKEHGAQYDMRSGDAYLYSSQVVFPMFYRGGNSRCHVRTITRVQGVWTLRSNSNSPIRRQSAEARSETTPWGRNEDEGLIEGMLSPKRTVYGYSVGCYFTSPSYNVGISVSLFSHEACTDEGQWAGRI